MLFLLRWRFMQRLVIAATLLTLVCPGTSAERYFDFISDQLNESPKGFRSTVSGSGQPGDWKLVADSVPSALPGLSQNPVANKRLVLAQLSRDRTDERYPLLIFEEDAFGDFTVTTRFKIVDGEAERMAGIAFRIQDEKNYYYIRGNALGNNLYFFKRVDGQLFGPIGSKMEIPAGVWQEMSIECKGNEIRCQLNGKDAFPSLRDSSFASGKIGFWTKSDSVSYFCDTKVIYTPKEILAQVLVRDALKKYSRLQGLKIFAAATNALEPRIIASNDPEELGKPGQAEEKEVIEKGLVYYGRNKSSLMVTMPLHDCNGDTVAAVRVVMKPFPGQTEKNALARALPIVKQMEARVRSANDLTQ